LCAATVPILPWRRKPAQPENAHAADGAGIIFGVGAVIGMLAIGAGARDESLRFIEQLGVRNLLVESIPSTSSAERQQRRKSSQGLNERDVRIIQANLDSMNVLSPRRTLHPSRLLPKPVGEAPGSMACVRPTRRSITGSSRGIGVRRGRRAVERRGLRARRNRQNRFTGL